MNGFISPRLYIIDYYDDLIKNIDIYTEEELEKYQDNDLLSDNNTEDILVPKNDDTIETYGVNSRLDPYSDEYSYDIQLNNKKDSITKTKDYLNDVRLKAINALKLSQDENLKYYNSNMSIIKSSQTQMKIDQFKSKLFANKFCFLININDYKVYKSKSSKKYTTNQSVFKLYTIITDFYLNEKNIQEIKKLLLKQPLTFNDMETNFDSKTMISYLCSKYISGYLCQSPKLNGTSVIEICRSKLFSIDKIDASEKILSLNELCHLKSLVIQGESISEKHTTLNINQLVNLEYLMLKNIVIEQTMLSNLSHLRHLSLINCLFSKDNLNFLTNNYKLEYLHNQRGSASFKIDLRHLLDLKWISLYDLKIKDVDELELLPTGIQILEINTLLINSNFTQAFFQSINAPDLRVFKLVFHANYSNNMFKSEWFGKFKNLEELHVAMCLNEVFDFKWTTSLNSLRVLNLSLLKIVNLGQFISLKRLTRLLLYRNSIETISLNAFEYLPHLEEIDLSYNKINCLDRVFMNLKCLKVLKLNNNLLKTLNEGLFQGLNSLKELYLYENRLEKFDPKNFEGLNLDFLDLSNNFKIVDPSLFSGMNNVKRIKMKGTMLNEESINNDCNNSDFMSKIEM